MDQLILGFLQLIVSFLQGFIDFLPFDVFDIMHLAFGWFNWIVGAAYVLLAVRTCDGRRWKVAFGTMAAMNGITGACFIAVAIFDIRLSVAYFPIWICITAGVLSVVALLDLRRGPHRDWLHWLGVAYIGVAAFLSVACQVWIAMLNSP